MPNINPRTNGFSTLCLKTLSKIFVVPIGVFVLLSCGSETASDPTLSGGDSVLSKESSSSDKPEEQEPNFSVFAGNGSGLFDGDGGPAVNASMFSPIDITLDADGNLYIATDNRIRKVESSSGTISTVAGTGSPGSSGDGKLAVEAKLKSPEGVVVGSGGDIFIADRDNGRIRKVDGQTGIITTFAGGGIPKREGGILVTGDGGLATEAWFKKTADVALDLSGNVYFIADSRVRKVDADTGIISTVTGHGGWDVSGDGGPATAAGIAGPRGLTIDDNGDIYIADTMNQRVRKIEAATGIITTIAGIGKVSSAPTHSEIPTPPEGIGFSGDGGPGNEAMLANPSNVAIGPDGKIYIADTENDRIRILDPVSGVINTLLDGGAVRGETKQVKGTQDIGGMAGGSVEVTFTRFSPPFSVAVAKDGTVFIADTKQNKIVKFVP